jgi:hypothetical protein
MHEIHSAGDEEDMHDVKVMLGAIPLVMTEDYIKKASRRTSQVASFTIPN